MAQLSKLSARQTWDTIHRLAGDAEPVLLCFERPPFSEKNFCHRRMVAKWFETEFGVVVPEWSVPQESNPQSKLAL